MRKENIIEIQQPITIRQDKEEIVLEKGDKIKIVESLANLLLREYEIILLSNSVNCYRRTKQGQDKFTEEEFNSLQEKLESML